MANANTIGRLQGAPSPAQGTLVIPAYVPADGSPHVVTCQAGTAAILNVGGTQLLSGASSAPSYPSNFDGIAFKVRILGKVTTKAACNVTVAIQVGNNTTVTSGNTIATTGAKSVGTTSANFCLEATVLWDLVTAAVGGWQVGQVNNSLLAVAALQNVPVATFSDQTAGTQMTISEFVAETV